VVCCWLDSSTKRTALGVQQEGLSLKYVKFSYTLGCSIFLFFYDIVNRCLHDEMHLRCYCSQTNGSLIVVGRFSSLLDIRKVVISLLLVISEINIDALHTRVMTLPL
jgi:hypothetical protein